MSEFEKKLIALCEEQIDLYDQRGFYRWSEDLKDKLNTLRAEAEKPRPHPDDPKDRFYEAHDIFKAWRKEEAPWCCNQDGWDAFLEAWEIQQKRIDALEKPAPGFFEYWDTFSPPKRPDCSIQKEHRNTWDTAFKAGQASKILKEIQI